MQNFSRRTRLCKSHVHGIGLFAICPIRKGWIVTRYKGRMIDEEEFDKQYGNKCGTYVVYLGEGKYLDGSEFRTKGKYANDALGTSFRNNAKIVTNNSDNRTYLVAKRNIHPGEEILVSYGQDYWASS